MNTQMSSIYSLIRERLAGRLSAGKPARLSLPRLRWQGQCDAAWPACVRLQRELRS